ncbi:MAG: hypothetical protein Q4G62_08650 [Pseudomonadota bacterium]|nr:hypothetical protein [Pseudomonadota bacterium]
MLRIVSTKLAILIVFSVTGCSTIGPIKPRANEFMATERNLWNQIHGGVRAQTWASNGVPVDGDCIFDYRSIMASGDGGIISKSKNSRSEFLVGRGDKSCARSSELYFQVLDLARSQYSTRSSSIQKISDGQCVPESGSKSSWEGGGHRLLSITVMPSRQESYSAFFERGDDKLIKRYSIVDGKCMEFSEVEAWQ